MNILSLLKPNNSPIQAFIHQRWKQTPYKMEHLMEEFITFYNKIWARSNGKCDSSSKLQDFFKIFHPDSMLNVGIVFLMDYDQEQRYQLAMMYVKSKRIKNQTHVFELVSFLIVYFGFLSKQINHNKIQLKQRSERHMQDINQYVKINLRIDTDNFIGLAWQLIATREFIDGFMHRSYFSNKIKNLCKIQWKQLKNQQSNQQDLSSFSFMMRFLKYSLHSNSKKCIDRLYENVDFSKVNIGIFQVIMIIISFGDISRKDILQMSNKVSILGHNLRNTLKEIKNQNLQSIFQSFNQVFVELIEKNYKSYSSLSGISDPDQLTINDFDALLSDKLNMLRKNYCHQVISGRLISKIHSENYRGNLQLMFSKILQRKNKNLGKNRNQISISDPIAHEDFISFTRSLIKEECLSQLLKDQQNDPFLDKLQRGLSKKYFTLYRGVFVQALNMLTIIYKQWTNPYQQFQSQKKNGQQSTEAQTIMRTHFFTNFEEQIESHFKVMEIQKINIQHQNYTDFTEQQKSDFCLFIDSTLILILETSLDCILAWAFRHLPVPTMADQPLDQRQVNKMRQSFNLVE